MFVVSRARLIKVILTTFLISYLVLVLEAKSKRKLSCVNGLFDAVTGDCVCTGGWFGNRCQFARKRLTTLEGTIADVPGKHGYSSKCLWLIEATQPNSTIQLSVDQYWSTSTWYNLYIYNGSSFRAPLLAAFSGNRRENCTGESVLIKTTSTTVLIYFFRDTNNVNSGFKLKYSVNNCSSSCSSHGACDGNGKCLCDLGWAGRDCGTRECPYTCIHGICDISTLQCQCQPEFSGQACNISSQHGTWTRHVPVNQDIAQKKIEAVAGVIGDWVWLYGGFSLADKPFNNIIRYSFSRNKWQVVSVSNSSKDEPDNRYGHSLAVHNRSLIIFGGITDKDTVNTLWSFSTVTRQWYRLRREGGDKPYAVAGHTATIVNNKMIVIFGYGPLYGFTNRVQQYDLVTSKWKILNTTAKEGTYGHTSHYDPITKLIYVHGGRTKTRYSDGLYSYNPLTNYWTQLSGSKFPHFLHSSVLVGNIILVFGGNIFTNDKNPKCFVSDLMAYDIICNKWTTKPQGNLQSAYSGGFGHTAVLHNSKMYVFGGFNGVMKKDLFSYSLGNCSLWSDKSSCMSAYSTSSCLWDPLIKTCIGPEEGFSRMNSLDRQSCQVECSSVSSCGSCNAPGLHCKWCDGTCKKNSDSCIEPPVKECKFISTCKGPNCQSLLSNCKPYQSCNNNCQQCFERIGGSNTDRNMWCEAKKKCVGVNSYGGVFPDGPCNDWYTAGCPYVKCSKHKSCDSCHTAPGCGWCSDGMGTGRGICVEGGADGRYETNDLVGSMQCPRWYYMECPACQCNGHSFCGKGTSCLDCQNHTKGRHCEYCDTGYHGNPRNGGTCQECQCNGHAVHCSHLDGSCNCLVEGIVGKHCQSCDTKYKGNATNGQFCYFPLQFNQHKNFNVSGKTNLNIKFTATSTDKDLIFDIKIISGPSAWINITYSQGLPLNSKKEKVILKEEEIKTTFSRTFSHRELKFHEGHVTFKARIYKIDKDSSFRILAYFNQPSTLNINLLEFFLTFFGCFLSLLFVASIGWRIRSRYHSYLVTRQRRAERDRMANRPFATIHLLLPNDMEPISKPSPSPVAMEPLTKNKVSLATVIVLLPNGEEGVTPVGQCGVCFGGILLSHGNHHTCLRSRMGHKKSKKRATMTTYYL